MRRVAGEPLLLFEGVLEPGDRLLDSSGQGPHLYESAGARRRLEVPIGRCDFASCIRKLMNWREEFADQPNQQQCCDPEQNGSTNSKKTNRFHNLMPHMPVRQTV